MAEPVTKGYRPPGVACKGESMHLFHSKTLNEYVRTWFEGAYS
jgi:hypothetical protein